MSMSTAKSTEEDAVPYINVTPLIDVLLVLLIIFMVVSPLKPTRFEAKVPAEPKDQDDGKANPLTLAVIIDENMKLKLNKEDVADAGALGVQLSSLFSDRTRNGAYREGTTEVEKTVFIKAPRSVPYGEVVKIIDAIKEAGASPIGLQIDDLQ
ncbi:MAG: biopolymer transporter ExbD [Pyrinomonadaceae bacterium]|nr:biopolymer transporter ExbD [Pyrinomonadaceae bacterium]